MAPCSGLKKAEHSQSPISKNIAITVPRNNVSVPLTDMNVNLANERHVFSQSAWK